MATLDSTVGQDSGLPIEGQTTRPPENALGRDSVSSIDEQLQGIDKQLEYLLRKESTERSVQEAPPSADGQAENQTLPPLASPAPLPRSCEAAGSAGGGHRPARSGRLVVGSLALERFQQAGGRECSRGYAPFSH